MLASNCVVFMLLCGCTASQITKSDISTECDGADSVCMDPSSQFVQKDMASKREDLSLAEEAERDNGGQVPYVYATEGAKTCPVGHSPATAKECMYGIVKGKRVSTWGYSRGWPSSWWPTGCFESGNALYWSRLKNKALTTRGHLGICVKIQATCSSSNRYSYYNNQACCSAEPKSKTSCGASSWSWCDGTNGRNPPHGLRCSSFNAQCANPTKQHGETDSRTMYEAATVNAPAQCHGQQQIRTCNDGSYSEWTGSSFAHESCDVKAVEHNCVGHNACKKKTVACDGECDIECSAEYPHGWSCVDATMTGLKGTLGCFGVGACQRNKVTCSGDCEIQCDGQNACLNMKVQCDGVCNIKITCKDEKMDGSCPYLVIGQNECREPCNSDVCPRPDLCGGRCGVPEKACTGQYECNGNDCKQA